MSAYAPDAPICECHGEPMFWHKDKRRRNRGYWQCHVSISAATLRYEESEKGQATRVRYEGGDRRLVLAHRNKLNRFIDTALSLAYGDTTTRSDFEDLLILYYESWKASSPVYDGGNVLRLP